MELLAPTTYDLCLDHIDTELQWLNKEDKSKQAISETRIELFEQKKVVGGNRPVVYKEIVIVCRVCNLEFKTQRGFSLHLPTHNRIRRYNCPQCDENFTHEQSLISHINFHHKKEVKKQDLNVRKYICNICRQDFESFECLKKHWTQTHQKEKQMASSKKWKVEQQFHPMIYQGRGVSKSK